MKTVDIIIIGGGVVGCMTARALSRYHQHVLLIEKENDIGMGATSANSAIVHAGYDPVTGTLKAKMNVAGNAMWDTLSGELGFDFERRGDYVVAVGAEELAPLESLHPRGDTMGCRGCISSRPMRCACANLTSARRSAERCGRLPAEFVIPSWLRWRRRKMLSIMGSPC